MRPLESILDDWQDWPVSALPILNKVFTEGLNHETALLNVGREQLVLKRFLAEPARQIESQLWAASLGIAPEVIYAPPNHEYVLMEALQGSHLQASKIDTVNLQSIAQGLSVMHNARPGPKSVEGFDIRNFCAGYLNESDNKAQQLHKALKPVLNLFHNDSTPWVFCHNDLVAANCFMQGNRVHYIDWEYADLHNPWFDLAAIIVYFNLNDDQARTLLSSYKHQWQEKVGEPIFYASQITLLWSDMLWHLNKFGERYWPQLALKEVVLNELRRKFKT